MKRTAVMVAAIAIILGWIASRPSAPDPAREDDGPATAASGPRRSATTPDEALRKLQHLRSLTPTSGTRFSAIQKLASRLSHHDLTELIHQVGVGESRGYDAWLRSALFAEWARRDLEAALAYIRQPDSPKGTYDSCLQEAHFAIFRGSRPDDPAAALAHIDFLRNERDLGKWGSGTDWIEHANQRLFAELSRQDPDRAWALLPDPSHGAGFHTAALRGLFEGLSNPDQIARYAKRWHETRFDAAHDKREPTPVRTLTRSFILSPPRNPNEDATVIAGVWMESSPQAATEWIMTQASADAEIGTNRVADALNQWAYHHPEQALAALRENRFPKHATGIAIHLLRADAHLAPQLVTIPDPSFHTHTAFVGSMTLNAMLEGAAQYPDPQRHNRPPDYLDRAASLRAAIETPDLLSEKRRHELLLSLDRQFESHLRP